MKDYDDIYKAAPERVGDFEFDDRTARVFDDMALRSIPFYGEIQRMILELSTHFVRNCSYVYDLGCATGATLKLLMEQFAGMRVEFVGIDESESMLRRAEKKLKTAFPGLYENHCSLIRKDLNAPLTDIHQASIVLMNWTLQFIKPRYRLNLVKNIHEGLLDKGCLILCEKIAYSDPGLNALFINCYHHFKRTEGYSDLEISRKDEALKKILLPFTAEKNLRLLKQAGFKSVDIFFRWYNWAGFIAIK